ncbi:hypothetical protein MLD38_021699 [Melastoma candidum]|nr:hypothetical protein MLD38_021699 [Melastoma candidum]
MPGDLLEWLVEGSGEDENKYASIKCVGAGDLVYVFNEEYYSKYPACVCAVRKGEWRKLPELPSPFNKFHKVITFSSQVSIQSVLPQAREGVGGI